jgi:predicted regulator of Ras-like GTPase activity (Roadblock/LC7/MglB family)
MPGDAKRPRTIFTPYESLLLGSAQTFDETAANGEPSADKAAEPQGMSRVLQPLARVRGVESLLLTSGAGECDAWGVETPEVVASWTHQVLGSFQKLGEYLNSGPLRTVEAVGSVRGVVMLQLNGQELMAGLDRRFNSRMIRAAGKELATYLGKE